jgi:hypothetical protein
LFIERLDNPDLRQEILTPLSLLVAVIVELHTWHGRAVAVITSMLAPDVGIDYPVAKAFFPET